MNVNTALTFLSYEKDRAQVEQWQIRQANKQIG
jgi:hypothetical protein